MLSILVLLLNIEQYLKILICFSLIRLKEIIALRILTSFGITARGELHNFILHYTKKENVVGT